MKNKLLLALLLVSLWSCHSNGTEAEEQESTLAAEPIPPVALAAATVEPAGYLDWQSVRVNGKYPLATSIHTLDELIGKPDSVISIDWNNTCSSGFRSEDSQIAYYGGYQFEQFGDSLYFQSVDFRKSKDIFLQSNDLKLSSSTTLEEIKGRFPEAASRIKKMDVYEMGEVDAIAIPPSQDLSDGHWLLMFRNGKLIRLDDWFPC
jgi:hypothetical protein